MSSKEAAAVMPASPMPDRVSAFDPQVPFGRHVLQALVARSGRLRRRVFPPPMTGGVFTLQRRSEMP